MCWLLLMLSAVVVASWLTCHKRRKLKPAAGEPLARPIITQNTVKTAADSAGERGKQGDPAEMTQAATVFLRDWLFPVEISKITALLEKCGHQQWVWHLHDEEIAQAELYPQEKKYAVLLQSKFGFGMQVRNALRRAGFGEQELGVPSLDDIYVDLLEAAVRQPPDPECSITGVEFTPHQDRETSAVPSANAVRHENPELTK